jgi:hypothetical protein
VTPTSAPPAAAPAGPAEACELLAAAETPRHPDTITIALTSAVGPAHAPTPRTESERLLFAQLYEPLVRVDCTGRVIPALAAAWSADSSGHRWTFTVRADARFWDGTPVTAPDILSAWRAHERSLDSAHRWSPFAALAIDSAIVDDARTLTVVLHDAHRELPWGFASPALAVTKRGDSEDMWPQGTGDYRVDAAASAGGAVVARAARAEPAPVLDFRSVPAADARDVLDGGADLLVTSVPDVVDYAATRPDFASVPVPWERTYVLLAPARAGHADAPPADTAFRAALARDAVRTEARAAAGPFWWDDACGAAETAAPTSREQGTSHRVVYPRGDHVARDLADRLVALAAIGERGPGGAASLASIIPVERDDGTRLIATGLEPRAFAAALHSGRDAAYVIGVPRRVLARCADARALAERVPWLAPRTIVPLVDTRSRLIARRTVGGVSVDWDGTLRISTAPTRPDTTRP